MSQPFVWDAARMALNVAEMDGEHRRLIDLMNKLQALHEAGAPAADQGKAFAALADFTQKHFAHEEAYMARVGYPGLAVHQGVHRNLMAKINEHALHFRDHRQFSPDLFAFLHMWLRSHICGVDMKYAAHVNGEPATAASA